MSSIAVIGLQWGDEGKGKVVDLFSQKATHVARAQGGNNAGHTIVAHGNEYKFHLIPSGILYPHTRCYIGGGTVIDPASILQEIESLKKYGIAALEERLMISFYAHLIFPYHKKIDLLSEKRKGSSAVGTTGRGIGPCYTDKVNRCGIRIADWMDKETFRKKLEEVLIQKNWELDRLYDHPPLDLDSLYEEYTGYADQLRPFIGPVEERLYAASQNKEKILYEGAQGSLLDITFGTYPFVTSSCTIAGGIAAGLGVGPNRIERTIGIAKAYTTRVGFGPLPTELSEKELLSFPDHSHSREMGTTTGRKRRMGWLDTFLLRHTICINGIDSLAIMKLDILDSLDEIQICVGYEGCEFFPPTIQALSDAKPIYEKHKGWKTSTTNITNYNDLPPLAKSYVKRIEQLCQIPVSLISVGPDRKQTIWVDRIF